MRKLRLWVCRKCGRAWSRKRTERYSPFKCCGEYVEVARKYPKRRISHYERVQEKIRKFNERYKTIPRTDIGTSLRLSKETKKAFKLYLRTKQQPAFLRRAKVFIETIAKDFKLYMTEKDNEKSWTKRIDKDGNISKSKGGLNSIPSVSYREMYSTLGLYSRAVLQNKHSIELSPKSDITEMCKTLSHETLHWIDDCSGMWDSGHDHYWNMRLEKFNKMLGIKS